MRFGPLKTSRQSIRCTHTNLNDVLRVDIRFLTIIWQNIMQRAVEPPFACHHNIALRERERQSERETETDRERERERETERDRDRERGKERELANQVSRENWEFIHEFLYFQT